MSTEDENKIFNDISKAIRDGDANALAELTKAEAREEEESEKITDEEEQPEDKTDETEKESSDTAEGDENTPTEESEEAEEKKEDDEEEEDEVTSLRAQLEQLKKDNNHLRSQAGRVPHIQKRMREFDKKLEELSKASPSSHTSTKVAPKIDEVLKGIAGTDKELAEAIKAAILAATTESADTQHAEQLNTLKLLRDADADEYMESEKDKLLAMYPNAPEVFKSPHWAEWKSKQSESVQRLAGSNSADDVDLAFQKYARDMSAQYPELEDKKDDKAAKHNDEAASKAQKVEQERQRKKESAATVASPNAAGKVKLPDDPEALFKRYSEQLRKEREGK